MKFTNFEMFYMPSSPHPVSALPQPETTMKIDVHWKHLTATASAQAHLIRRLSFSLGRFADRVRSVRAVLSDENGPRGGLDKHCRLQVRTPQGLVQVVERDSDVLVAIDLASDRLHRALGRLFDRVHFQNHGGWRSQGLARRRHDSFGSRSMRGQLP